MDLVTFQVCNFAAIAGRVMPHLPKSAKIKEMTNDVWTPFFPMCGQLMYQSDF